MQDGFLGQTRGVLFRCVYRTHCVVRIASVIRVIEAAVDASLVLVLVLVLAPLVGIVTITGGKGAGHGTVTKRRTGAEGGVLH